ELFKNFGGRKTCSELKKRHLCELSQQSRFSRIELWSPEFFEKIWNQLEEDLEKTGQGKIRAPLLFWFEKLSLRIRDESPPAEPLKSKFGIQIYRLQQAPVSPDSFGQME